jgi:hypothetical protein
MRFTNHLIFCSHWWGIVSQKLKLKLARQCRALSLASRLARLPSSLGQTLVMVAWLLAILGSVGFPAGSFANRYSPESPEVQALVERAVAFLEKEGEGDGRFGAEALAALALLKAGRDPSHPLVRSAVESVRKNIPRSDQELFRTEMVYSLSVSIIFLCELDPVAYRREIQELVNGLRRLQKSHGGWGYPAGHKFEQSGDTSMTQFAILALWEAVRAGIAVPGTTIAAAAAWFIRTQDPSGAWGYQGTISPDWTPVRQLDIRHSVATAALASLYMIWDLAGLGGKGKKENEESSLPAVIREVRREQAFGPADVQVRVDPKLLQMAIARGKAWHHANYQIDPPRFRYYYLYALERMWTFREFVEGPVPEAPPWYDQGVEFLRRTQQENGSWFHECGTVPDTAFGILFLVRSMKKSVERVRSFGEGTLIGGRGLPKNTSQVVVVGGQVIAKPELGDLEKLLAALDAEDAEERLEVLELLAELPPDEASRVVSRQGQKLLALAGSPSKEAKVAALRALGRSGAMEHVPVLIYALGDTDPAVVLEARNALRRISRRWEDFGPPDNYTPDQQREAIRAWEEWYRSIRPDPEFAE